jgi:hypothetical protein
VPKAERKSGDNQWREVNPSVRQGPISDGFTPDQNFPKLIKGDDEGEQEYRTGNRWPCPMAYRRGDEAHNTDETQKDGNNKNQGECPVKAGGKDHRVKL